MFSQIKSHLKLHCTTVSIAISCYCYSFQTAGMDHCVTSYWSILQIIGCCERSLQPVFSMPSSLLSSFLLERWLMAAPSIGSFILCFLKGQDRGIHGRDFGEVEVLQYLPVLCISSLLWSKGVSSCLLSSTGLSISYSFPLWIAEQLSHRSTDLTND